MSSRMIIVVGVALAVATPVLAEPETGSRIDTARGSVTSSDMEAERAELRVMNKFARCVARNRNRKATTLLGLPYLSSEQSKLVSSTIGGEDGCLGSGDQELRFKPPAIIGGLAEELVLSRKNLNVDQIAGMTDEAMDAAGLAPRNLAEDFGQCVARRTPALSVALIKTDPGSKEESIIAKQLAPQLGPCLVEGSKLSLTSYSVRSIVAVGLYRMLGADVAPGAPNASR